MSRTPIRKSFLWTILIINLIALPVIYFKLHERSTENSNALPIYGQVVETYRFTEKNGKETALEMLKGKIYVANFMFTNCPGACPMMSGKLKQLQNDLPREVLLASFSVDPTNDTPAALTEYAKKYSAEEGRWFFFTGGLGQTNRLLEELHLGKIDEPSAHSLRFILLDKNLRIRGYYDSTDSTSVQKLVSDAKFLIKEKS